MVRLGIRTGHFSLVNWLAAAFLVCDASAAEYCPDITSASPASVVDSETNQAIIDSIWPSLKDDETYRTATFEAYIDTKGRLTNIMFTNRRGSRFNIAPVARKLKRMEFAPASLDGEPLRAYVSMTVIAARASRGLDRAVVMNRLIHARDFGVHYSAPQRLAEWTEFPGNRYELALDLQVMVGTDGTVSEHAVDEDLLEKHRNVRQFTKALEETCYVPGMVDGTAQGMMFSERFMSWQSGLR